MSFLTCVKESSINVDSYVSKKNVSSGLKYLTILLFIISLLTVAPNIYDLFSSVEMEKIPDFEIQNGELTVFAEQPYYVGENFVIDTTGSITQPVLDEGGYGVLITENDLILERPFEERRIELSLLEITNKEELEILLYGFLLIFSPIVFILVFIGNIIEYLFYISVLSVLGYVLIRRKDTFKSVFAICIYSFTPYIILSFIDLFAQFYVGMIGLVWTLIIYGLALKKHSTD